jgi:hypothetical protein
MAELGDKGRVDVPLDRDRRNRRDEDGSEESELGGEHDICFGIGSKSIGSSGKESRVSRRMYVRRGCYRSEMRKLPTQSVGIW